MKRIYFLIILMIGLCNITDAQKTVSFKADANLGFSTPSISVGGSSISTDMKPAYRISLGLELPLTDDTKYGQFYLSPALTVLSRGYKMNFVDNNNNRASINAAPNYFQVPIQAGVRWKLADRVGISFQAGPYIALGLSGDIDIKLHDKTKDIEIKPDYFGKIGFKKFDCGGVFQIAFEYSIIYLQMGADFGFINTSNNKKSIGNKGESEEEINYLRLTYPNLKNRSFFIGIGIHF